MAAEGRRSSDRIELKIPIEIVGTDCLGTQFFDRTHTLLISRHGGKIGLERQLVPEQEVTIRCLATGREAEARIVGQMGQSTRDFYYGIKFLGAKENIWGIEFPPVTEAAGSVGGVLLECIGCKNQEEICLDDFELEVLEVNGRISRSCRRCRDVSFWRTSRREIPETEEATPAPASLPVPTPFQDQRREDRREMRVTACVRTTRLGQDLVKTRSVSHRGLCFTSPWEYVPGEAIEVAVPYSPGGGNIFLPAKIFRLQLLASQGTRIYGVAFP